MSTRPIPAHGTEARYQGGARRPGCRCTACKTAWTKACQARLLAHLSGRPPRIPAAPVTRHLQKLNSAGMSASQIARAAGVSRDTVGTHLHGRSPSILRGRAERLLAVRPNQRDNHGRLSALGTRRRLQALYAAGHGSYSISASTSGITPRAIDNIIRGINEEVTVSTHEAVIAAYRQLSGVAGGSVRTRLRAQREGWPGPEYWDDDDFDNEQFEPATTDNLKRDDLGATRRAEIEHLDSFGLSEHEIASRLGMRPRYVHDIVRELHTGQRRDRPKRQLDTAA